MISKYVYFVVIFLFAFSSEVALAEDDARMLHKKGVQLFKEGRFEGASEAFREANRLRPTWKLHYNIGQCEAAAKRYGLALESFEIYLVEGGDDVPDDRRESVSSEIRRIQPLVGTLQVDAPQGMIILVDGFRRGVTPVVGPVRVGSGKHVVILKDEADEVIMEQEVTIAGGMTTQMSAHGEDVSTAPLAPSPTVGEDHGNEGPEMVEGRPALRGAGWVFFATGAVTLVGGGITGIFALKKNEELQKVCPDKDSCDPQYKSLEDEADTLALDTNILLVAGGALTVTGIIFLIASRKRKSGDDKSAVIDFSAEPIVNADGAGLVFSGRF